MEKFLLRCPTRSRWLSRLAKWLSPAAPGDPDAARVAGTWGYIAPEQLSAPESVDHRADVFSTGVVCYEMLTGEVPGG